MTCLRMAPFDSIAVSLLRLLAKIKIKIECSTQVILKVVRWRRRPHQSAAAGLKNMLRFQGTGEENLMERVRFGKEVLFGPLSDSRRCALSATEHTREVLCVVLHHHPAGGGERGLFRANATAPALSAFQVESLCRHTMRVLTVHMFNPWVTEETLVCYLSRY